MAFFNDKVPQDKIKQTQDAVAEVGLERYLTSPVIDQLVSTVLDHEIPIVGASVRSVVGMALLANDRFTVHAYNSRGDTVRHIVLKDHLNN